jgi:dTDP-4-dehydrorhamnose 3,5-epimerase
MKFTELPLSGAFLIELEAHHDARGFFARTFCTTEFEKHGLSTAFVQCSTSFNFKKGQIRGMHYQIAPFEETKLVRCVQGSIYDVIVDLREDSSSFKKVYGIVLSAQNNKMLYIPKGFAHGYQVLENNTEIFYMMDEFYKPEAAREISPFNSDIATLTWPLPIIGEK